MFTVRRMLSATAAAAAVLAALPAPAHAAPADPYTLSVHDLGVSPAGKVEPMRLAAQPGATTPLNGVQVVFDTTDIAGFATASTADYSSGKPKPSAGCTTVQTTVTCKVVTVTGVDLGLPDLLVQLKDSAKVGQHGTLTVTVKSEQSAPLVAKPTISVAKDVDLAAGPQPAVSTVKPGDAVEQPIEITNTGTESVRGAGLEMVLNTKGLSGAPRYSNCNYTTDDHLVFCKFTEKLAPGTTYRIAEPTLQVKPDAPAGGEFFYAQFWSTGDDVAEQGTDWYDGAKVTPGDGPVVHLEAVPAANSLRAKTTDSNTANNVAFGYVKTPVAPHPSTSGSPTATATTTAGSGTAAGSGTGGGGLAITGSNTMLAAGAGVLLLLVGGGLFVFTRRRRTSFTA